MSKGAICSQKYKRILDKKELVKSRRLQMADGWQFHPANGFGPRMLVVFAHWDFVPESFLCNSDRQKREVGSI